MYELKSISSIWASTPTSFRFCWTIRPVCSRSGCPLSLDIVKLNGSPSFWSMPPWPGVKPASLSSAFALSGSYGQGLRFLFSQFPRNGGIGLVSG